MVDNSSTRSDLKNAIAEIRLKLQDENVTNEQVQLMARGLYNRFTSDYDVVRQEALDCCKDNAAVILKHYPNELFYSIQKCLWTQNRSYDAIIHSESSRFTLLTLLLKFLIYLQKKIENEKINAVEYLTQYQIPIKQILIKQFPDNCPENRQQVCKCIYRMSIAYRRLLSDDDVEEISAVIVQNFNHQRHQVRELSLQAFVQLHLCDKSKSLREHYPAILNFLLPNDDSKEMLLEASTTLLSQHIDRHVYAPMISVAFMANLQEKDFYDAFNELGEQYIKENAKYDKFLQIQCEMQTTSEVAAEFFNSMNTLIKQFSGCSHFTQQMNGGCRTIAYLCLNNNVEVLVNEAVSLKTDINLRKKLIRLITNLILINQWNIRKFGQVFTAKLAELSQSPDFQSLCGLVIRFLPFEQVQKYLSDKVIKGFRDQSLSIPALKALCLFTQTIVNISLEDIQNIQLNEQEGDKVVNSIGQAQLSSHYKDELKDLYYERVNKSNLPEILKTFFSENGQNFIEDSDYIASFDDFLKCLSELPAEIISQKDILAKVVCGMASIVRHYEQISVLTMEQKNRFKSSQEIYSHFCCKYLDGGSLTDIDMKMDVSVAREQLARTEILATILKLTTESDFPTRAKTPLLTVALKLLKTAQDDIRAPEKTRLASLQCTALIVQGLPLTPAEQSLLISGLLKAAAWKVVARAPQCLVEAYRCIQLILEASINKGKEDETSSPLQHFPALLNSVRNQMEEDDFICRRASLQLCDKIIQYAMIYDWKNFEETQYALVQRLNDAKTVNSIEALELFVKLTNYLQKLKENRENITDLLITHINDSVTEIRKKSFWALKSVATYLDKDIVTEKMEGKNFEFFDMKEVFDLIPEADGSWAHEKALKQNQPKPEHIETNVLSAIGLDPLEKEEDNKEVEVK